MKGNFYRAIGGVFICFTLAFASTQQASAQACDTILADFSSNAPRCTGDSVDFVFTQTAYGGLTYLWDFGTGASPSTSTAQNPSGIVYSSAGLKLITLTVTHAGLGCVKTKTGGINIVETPNPSFTDDGPNCEQEEFTFSYTGTNNTGWTYSWDFGSGANPAVSSAQNPIGVKYTGPGTKNVNLTVTNGACAASVSQNVTVSNKPDANFSFVSPSCTSDSNTFTNTGSTGLTYSWNFGSGANPGTSTAENPGDIFYTSSGSKTITQIVIDGACSDTSVQSMSITEKPAPNYTSNAPQCEGAVVNFTHTGTTGTGWTYSWDFGAGASPSVSTAESPNGVTYTGSGSKSVSVTVSNQNCSNTFSQNITINTTPQSGFSSSSPACTGDSVNFSNTGSGSQTYAWDFGTGATPATSTNEDPLGIIYSSAGIKTIRQIVTQGTCTDTTFGNVSVTETPVPAFTSNGPQCEGADVNFTYTGNTGTGWTYLWDFGQGATPSISTAQNPIGVAYTGAGTKTVTLTVTNQFCSETVTGNVTINPTPTAGFSSNTPGCTGDSINFQNNGTTGQTYAWAFGTGSTPATSTSENPMGIIYSTSGFKSIQQVVTQGTCTDTAWATISLTETPDPSFVSDTACQGSGHTFTYTGTTGSNWIYNWDFGNASSPRTSTAQNPTGIVYTTFGSGLEVTSLTVTNQSCSRTFEDTVRKAFSPGANITVVASACSGDTVQFFGGATGGNASWTFTGTPASSSDANPFVVFTPGTQTATLVNTAGKCSDSTSTTILINETPSIGIQSTAPQCVGSDVSFVNVGSTGSNWNFIWDFGNGASPNISTSEMPSAIKYATGGNKLVSLSINDANCSYSDSVEIVIYSLPNAFAGLDTTICADECLSLGDSGIAGNQYQWFPSSTLDSDSISNPTACPTASINQYTLTVTDTSNCVNSDTVVVTMLPSAIANAGTDVSTCVGDTVQIGVALRKGQTYTWTPSEGLDNDTTSAPFASPDSTTVYQVAVSYKGCEVITDEVLVTVHQNPIVSAGDDMTITEGGSTKLLATGGVMYQWTPISGLDNPGVSNPTASPESTITYVVEVTDINRCVNVDSLTVTVESAEAWAPEAFTPNGDHVNDIFYVRVKGSVSYEMVVFNRYGELIFRSTDPNTGWDGTRQGTREELGSGAYVYSAKGELTDGKSFNINGMVNLIR